MSIEQIKENISSNLSVLKDRAQVNFNNRKVQVIGSGAAASALMAGAGIATMLGGPLAAIIALAAAALVALAIFLGSLFTAPKNVTKETAVSVNNTDSATVHAEPAKATTEPAKVDAEPVKATEEKKAEPSFFQRSINKAAAMAKGTVAYAKAHPIKTLAAVAATAGVVYYGPTAIVHSVSEGVLNTLYAAQTLKESLLGSSIAGTATCPKVSTFAFLKPKMMSTIAMGTIAPSEETLLSDVMKDAFSKAAGVITSTITSRIGF